MPVHTCRPRDATSSPNFASPCCGQTGHAKAANAGADRANKYTENDRRDCGVDVCVIDSAMAVACSPRHRFWLHFFKANIARKAEVGCIISRGPASRRQNVSSPSPDRLSEHSRSGQEDSQTLERSPGAAHCGPGRTTPLRAPETAMAFFTTKALCANTAGFRSG